MFEEDDRRPLHGASHVSGARIDRHDAGRALEGGRGGMPRYGLMHLLACFTLFDNQPQLVNTILDGFLAVTRQEIQAVAKKYLRPENRAIVFRAPATKTSEKEAA